MKVTFLLERTINIVTWHSKI